MADKEEKGLIGFDPLAWMNDDSAGKEETPEPVGVNSSEQKDNADNVSERTDSGKVETMETEESVQTEESDGNGSKITLNTRHNIQNVSDLHETLMNYLNSQNTIEIDASAVDSIDTATLQLLIVLKQTAIKLQKEVVIDFPSNAFIEAAELLGLSEMLGVDQSAAGFF